jgi:GTP-binding protein LepA
MDIERERGITIKAQTVRLDYKAKDGETYILNLMDTPGHVDFAYEVSRSLAACEGSLLVVDASPGRRGADAGQRLSGDRQQPRDRPGPQQDRPAGRRARAHQAADRGRDRPRRLRGRADLGQDRPRHPGVLEAIVTRLPPPKGDLENAPLKALLVDSWYDAYLGVVVLVRVIDGVLKKGQTIRMMGTAAYQVDRVGVFTPKMLEVDSLGPGEIGFFTASIKEVADTRVGDTITDDKRRRRRRCRASSRPSRWCSAASSRSMPPISRTCAPPWASCASTTPASPSRWNQRRARLRLPLRLPRPAASGDHPGAAGARVRPRPDRHRPERRLQAEA